MAKRAGSSEIVLPRIKLWQEPEGYIVVLECICGHAVQYPGHPAELVTSTCEACGVSWRCLGHADLLRAIGG